MFQRQLSADDGAQVLGVTAAGEELFVLHGRSTDQIDVYSNTDFTFSRHISVPGLNMCGIEDFTSCDSGVTAILLIADSHNQCVHRLMRMKDEKDWTAVKLPLSGKPCLSSSVIIYSFHIPTLVLGCYAESFPRGRLIELNYSGTIIREVVLHSWISDEPERKPFPSWISSLSCARKLENGDVVVSYRSWWCAQGETIAIADSSGKITQSYGDWWFPGERELLKGPCHLAVDDDGFVFVADSDKHRVLLLNPKLQFVRFIATKNRPRWLHFDKTHRRLLVSHDSNTVTILQLPPRPYCY